MKQKKIHLKDLVSEWLKKNHPLLYVSKDGSIGLISEKHKKSQAFGVVYYGSIWDTYAEVVNPARPIMSGKFTIIIKAADPKFFEKLDKYLKD